MRALATWMIALGLIASPAMAGARGAGDKNTTAAIATASNGSAGNSAASAAPAADSKTDATAKAEASSMELELDQLRGLLESQAKQIQEQNDQLSKQQERMASLEAMVHLANPGTAAASASANIGAAAPAPAPQTAPDLTARLANVEKQVGALSSLKFSGDLRLRFEPFFGGGATTSAAPANRMRERYRLRFNINTKVANDFGVGFSLASGDLGDPISTNSTETGFFTRKPIAVDKAFGVYTPHQFKPLTITVGKFGYTWLRTELTWDNDTNPEGASEAVAWDWKTGFLSHLGIIAFQTPMFEVGGGPDTYMAGGQIQTAWKVSSPIKFTLDGAYYHFANADTIAQNQGQTPGNGFATQGIAGTGGSNFGFGGSSLTNNFGVIAGKRVFASKFGIFDAIARLDFDTGNKRWPIYALFDFAQNTQACGNIQTFIAAAVTPPTCDPHQRHGYWSELKFGQTKNQGDLLLGYTFARIERDAVVSAFNFSDLRQPTNVVEHRIEASYQAYPHVQIGMTGLFGRQLITSQSTTPERWLKRWQFDTVFSF